MIARCISLDTRRSTGPEYQDEEHQERHASALACLAHKQSKRNGIRGVTSKARLS